MSESNELRKRQAEFTKELHGNNVTKSGFSALVSKNKSAQTEAVAKYLKHWDGKTDADAERRRLEDYNESTPVSYTHLDVYKRQPVYEGPISIVLFVKLEEHEAVCCLLHFLGNSSSNTDSFPPSLLP